MRNSWFAVSLMSHTYVRGTTEHLNSSSELPTTHQALVSTISCNIKLWELYGFKINFPTFSLCRSCVNCEPEVCAFMNKKIYGLSVCVLDEVLLPPRLHQLEQPHLRRYIFSTILYSYQCRCMVSGLCTGWTFTWSTYLPGWQRCRPTCWNYQGL